MGVSQIGNGDFPLNNCAILRQILPDTSIDFLTTVLRGEAFANPIANLAGSVKGKIGAALGKIGSLGGANNSASWISEMNSTLQSFNTELVDFESRTNRMSGVITGFQDGQPDMGRILGIGSAYNSALATLATKPQDILKDNFSHGFNSLKQEFGVNAITESDNALEAAGNFLAQFGLGTNEFGDTSINPNPFQFYSEANQILGNIRSIQQSIVNITSAEDAFLAGALAFLDKYALANTALNGVLTDPCQIGKVIKDLAASPDLTNLIPSLNFPEPPTLDEILSNIPDPEDIGNAIKDSVEGIVESVQEQVEQLIDDAVAIGKETVKAIQKSAEELIAAGEAIIEQAEQAAADLATNVENFGKDVEKFFEDLENRLDGDEEAADEEAAEEEGPEDPEAAAERLDDEVAQALVDGRPVSDAVNRAFPFSPGSQGSGGSGTQGNLKSIGSGSGGIEYNSQYYELAVLEYKRKVEVVLGGSNVDRVLSKQLNIQQLNNLSSYKTTDGIDLDPPTSGSGYSSSDRPNFASYASSEFGISPAQNQSNTGNILRRIAEDLKVLLPNPKKYLDNTLIKNRTFKLKGQFKYASELENSDRFNLDPLDPQFDSKFADLVAIYNKELQEKREELEKQKQKEAEEAAARKAQYEEEQRRLAEAQKQADLADGRVRPSWVPKFINDQKDMFNLQENVSQSFYWVFVVDLNRAVEFYTGEYRSKEQRDSRIEELKKYRTILGRGLSSEYDYREVTEIMDNGKKAKDVVPTEMTFVGKIYQDGLLSGSNVDSEKAAQALRDVLSDEELTYYLNMANKLVSVGNTGVTNISGIIQGLSRAKSLPL